MNLGLGRFGVDMVCLLVLVLFWGGGMNLGLGRFWVDMVCLLVLVMFRVGEMSLGMGRFVVDKLGCWLVVVLIWGACSVLVMANGCVSWVVVGGEPARSSVLLDILWTAGGDGEGDKVLKNFASADGGPRSRVCARKTLRLALHRH